MEFAMVEEVKAEIGGWIIASTIGLVDALPIPTWEDANSDSYRRYGQTGLL